MWPSKFVQQKTLPAVSLLASPDPATAFPVPILFGRLSASSWAWWIIILQEMVRTQRVSIVKWRNQYWSGNQSKPGIWFAEKNFVAQILPYLGYASRFLIQCNAGRAQANQLCHFQVNKKWFPYKIENQVFSQVPIVEKDQFDLCSSIPTQETWFHWYIAPNGPLIPLSDTMLKCITMFIFCKETIRWLSLWNN